MQVIYHDPERGCEGGSYSLSWEEFLARNRPRHLRMKIIVSYEKIASLQEVNHSRNDSVNIQGIGLTDKS